MNNRTSQIESPFGHVRYEADAVALMDESHLVAVGADSFVRHRFGSTIAGFLQAQPDTEILYYHGQHIVGLDSFCSQLERLTPGPMLHRKFHGIQGIASALRARIELPGKPVARYRYHIWQDAHVLLHRDRPLFSKLLDLIAGIAAEHEYVDEDVLLIHRLLLIGRPSLEDYYHDRSAQCQRWLDDGCSPTFWELVSGQPCPAFTLLSLDRLAEIAREPIELA